MNVRTGPDFRPDIIDIVEFKIQSLDTVANSKYVDLGILFGKRLALFMVRIYWSIIFGQIRSVTRISV